MCGRPPVTFSKLLPILAIHHHLGKVGESAAVEFLRKKGCRVLETNFRFQHKEVDVIFLDGDVLVFGEIKTRSSLAGDFPEEAVGKRKQAAIKQVAQAYSAKHPYYAFFRFDVLSLLLHKGKLVELRHFVDAF